MHNEDEAPSRGLKRLKKPLIFVVGGLSLFAISAYVLARLALSATPERIKSALLKQGIDLSYKSINPAPGGLGFELTELSISGKNLPVSAKAASFSIRLAFAQNIKPIMLEVTLSKTLISKNTSVSQTPPTAEKSKPSSPSFLVITALKLLQPKIVIEDLTAAEYGFKHFHYSIMPSYLSLSSDGFPVLKAEHTLSVEELLEYPQLNGIQLTGKIDFKYPKATLSPHTVSLFPFTVSFNADYDLQTTQWNLRSDIPKTDLTLKPIGFHSSLMQQYARIKGGTLSLQANLTGKGADFKSITGFGTLDLSAFKLKIKHVFTDGFINANIRAEFKKAADLNYTVDSDVDLSDLMFRIEKSFYKEVGVPLKLKLKASADEKLVKVEPSEFTFHSLNATFNGNIAVNPAQSSSINFKVNPTDLGRWERFFPRQTDLRALGTIAADGSFTGAFENWKMGKLDMNLQADDVEVPIFPEWIKNKETRAEGSLKLRSKTKIVLDNGEIKALGTDSLIGLSNLELVYGSFFKKARGTSMNVELSVKSSATKAEIKKGFIELDEIKVRTAGSINNFKNPVVSLSLDSSFTTLGQILKFCPSIVPKNVSNMAGGVALKAKVSGPLLSKAGPSVNGLLNVNKLSLGYELESTKKKIVLKELSGPIAFSNDSVSTNRLAFAFPSTQGVASFKVEGFAAPKVQFDLNAPTFSLKDFYDLPKGTKVPPGAIPVPVSKNDPKDDFRKNPYLKLLDLKGTLNVGKAALGYTTAEKMSAQIRFHKMQLSVKPFKMLAYGGSLTSETEWNGVPEIPTTKQAIKVENVNANQFLTSYSEQSKDLLEGRFSTDMTVNFSGMEPAEIKKSIEGSGNFSLKDGQVKTIRFTKGPLESLKKMPKVGGSINKTDWDERLNDASGSFVLKNGKLALSNLVLHSPYFDITASQATLDMDQNVLASVLWTPKNNLISGDTYEMLKDEQGKTSLPLTVSGNIMSPTVALDSNVIESRLKGYASRRLASEAEQAARQAREKAENEGKKKLQESLKGKIPQGLGNLF